MVSALLPLKSLNGFIFCYKFAGFIFAAVILSPSPLRPHHHLSIMVRSLDTLNLTSFEVSLLSIRGYTIGRPLASGGFGVVYLAQQYDTPIAVKALAVTPQTGSQIAREVTFLKTLHHPNIVPILDLMLVQGSTLLIFMELLAGGELRTYCRENRVPNEPTEARLFRQMVDALAYVHRRGITHHDLKCSNVLLDASKTLPKIADFGLASASYDPLTGEPRMESCFCGTDGYLPPEIYQTAIRRNKERIQHPKQTPTSKYCPYALDVYAMGVILYEMLHRGQNPFARQMMEAGPKPKPKEPKKPEPKERLEKYHYYYKVITTCQIKYRRDISASAVRLIGKLMSSRPEARPEMADILEDEWLAQAGPREREGEEEVTVSSWSPNDESRGSTMERAKGVAGPSWTHTTDSGKTSRTETEEAKSDSGKEATPAFKPKSH